MVMGSLKREADVVVIGGGPGGYVAAIRLADLGREVLLVEERERLGGVCLLEGCIPSKTLIHAVELAQHARAASRFGLTYEGLRVDPPKLRAWTEEVVAGLSAGVSGLLKRRGVEVLRGRARFDGPRSLRLEGGEEAGVEFRHAIIATGSRINELPTGYGTPMWSSAEALQIPDVPERLLVVGGGYIGLELGLVYSGLGSRVTLAEFTPRLLQGADPDLVDVVVRSCRARFESIQLDSRVAGVERTTGGFAVRVEHGGETRTTEYDQVLVAVGRRPNSDDLGLEQAGVEVDAAGFVRTDPQCRTTQPHIFAIGDVTPGPMLAHKASREGKVAAEVIAGHPAAFDNRAVPAVVFTDPELAWTGLTEQEAVAHSVPHRVGRFPLSALGRARTFGRPEGLVKVIVQPDTDLVLGVGLVGPMASELVAEATLAVEMGATLEDLMVTIHPHPTMSESLAEAAEVAAGLPIHVHPARKRS